MLPKMGRKLPLWTGALGGRETYAKTIAARLHKEHGDSHRAIKQLMRQTGASERTVKHWLSAQHGPDALYLLRLVVTSPIVRAFVLDLIEAFAANLAVNPVDRLQPATSGKFQIADAVVSGRAEAGARENVPKDVPERDPVNVPNPIEFSERQRWFLARIAKGGRYGAQEIAAAWQVSLKTARRDISTLQKMQLLEYVGSPRNGRYRQRSL